MISKYSIIDTDHIYYEISSEVEGLLGNFMKWYNSINGKAKITVSKEYRYVLQYDDGIRQFDFWWDVNSDNTEIKNKIKLW